MPPFVCYCRYTQYIRRGEQDTPKIDDCKKKETRYTGISKTKPPRPEGRGGIE
nr:MAG TPA: hypothetical protein [Caudoviricetes sp.]